MQSLPVDIIRYIAAEVRIWTALRYTCKDYYAALDNYNKYHSDLDIYYSVEIKSTIYQDSVFEAVVTKTATNMWYSATRLLPRGRSSLTCDVITIIKSDKWRALDDLNSRYQIDRDAQFTVIRYSKTMLTICDNMYIVTVLDCGNGMSSVTSFYDHKTEIMRARTSTLAEVFGNIEMLRIYSEIVEEWVGQQLLC